MVTMESRVDYDAFCAASTSDWPFQAAVPTSEDIRYASELRLQLRDRYLRRPERPVGPWCVGAD
jgi:hypothetical protein